MGAHPYWYIVPYESDVSAALGKLREREFNAGRYNPVIEFPEFPVTDESPAPGRQHESIEAVFDALNEIGSADGSRSILDIFNVADSPLGDDDIPICTARPLFPSDVQEYFGTQKPTWNQVKDSTAFANTIERGSAVYLNVYKDDEIEGILFVGYSFD
ncbi:hypothetical protein C3941_15365 [Kaistia algarum]|uniref:hypothetical protein n=1 Tax=Kaistia algarum TaxID=2083279 RepID=UPI000CE88B0C|nr:hypothetical protein [Kaistia algarum]MCX5514452.1 hypothetical protein [Kaistia algarum]PPE79185.1 hypothetical protein C3941_15365 [Kaistia algarum]